MPRTWRRRRSGGLDRSSREDDTVRLDDREHIWWAGPDEAPHAEPVDGLAQAAAARPAPRTEEELRAAFRKKRRAPDEPPVDDPGGFADYYSADSLFESISHTPGPSPPADDLFDADDPYAVLGVPASATWEEIADAHHRLAKLHHPDRLLGSADDVRHASEQRMRDLNIAYEELKRRRGL